MNKDLAPSGLDNKRHAPGKFIKSEAGGAGWVRSGPGGRPAACSRTLSGHESATGHKPTLPTDGLRTRPRSASTSRAQARAALPTASLRRPCGGADPAGAHSSPPLPGAEQAAQWTLGQMPRRLPGRMDPLLKLRPTAAGGDHLEIRFDPDSDSQICLWGKNFSTCLWRSLL